MNPYNDKTLLEMSSLGFVVSKNFVQTDDLLPWLSNDKMYHATGLPRSHDMSYGRDDNRRMTKDAPRAYWNVEIRERLTRACHLRHPELRMLSTAGTKVFTEGHGIKSNETNGYDESLDTWQPGDQHGLGYANRVNAPRLYDAPSRSVS